MITAVTRLRNEIEFISPCIENALPVVDELIIVVEKGSTDGTADVCETYRSKYPDLIKLYYYPYEVVPPASDIDPSRKSMAEYTTWAFSKATQDYVMKLDGDCILKVSRETLLQKLEGQYALSLFWLDVGRPFNKPRHKKTNHFLRPRIDAQNYFYPYGTCEGWYFPWQEHPEIPLVYAGDHMRFMKTDPSVNRGNKPNTAYHKD